MRHRAAFPIAIVLGRRPVLFFFRRGEMASIKSAIASQTNTRSCSFRCPMSIDRASSHARLTRRLSPLGWDHINLTGDYVWSDAPLYDVEGMRPLNREPDTLAA